MTVHVKVNGVEYPATVDGSLRDSSWDGRDTKTVHLEMEAEVAKELFQDDTPWSILTRWTVEAPRVDEEGEPVFDEDGNPIIDQVEQEDEFDNSDYRFAGDVIDHRDGTCSVKMGRPTDLEEAYELLYGGDEV